MKKIPLRVRNFLPARPAAKLFVELLEDRSVPASLSGVVYIDANGSGTFDTGDAGIPGVTVGLGAIFNYEDYGTGYTALALTDANGVYKFDVSGGPNAVYTITEAQPAGFNNGTNSVGTATGTVNGDQITGIQLASDQDATGYNFGETSPATINNHPVFNNNNNNTNTNNNSNGSTATNPPLAGYVYVDAGRDGTRQGDPGIPGVTLQLFNPGADGNLGTGDDTLVATTVTDSAGRYSFGNSMPLGLYRILETQPAGYTDSPASWATTLDVAYPAAGLSEQNFGELLPSPLTQTTAQPQTKTQTQTQSQPQTQSPPPVPAQSQSQTQTQSQTQSQTQTQTQSPLPPTQSPLPPTQSQTQSQSNSEVIPVADKSSPYSHRTVEPSWRGGASLLAMDFDDQGRDDHILVRHYRRHHR